MKKICSHPGCSKYAIEGHSRCEKHLDEENTPFIISTQASSWDYLYRTSKWEHMKENCLVSNPICQYCNQAQATEVHHIIPHRGNEELFYDEDNLVALCHDCHFKETTREIAERRSQSRLEKEIRRRYRLK